MQQTPDNSRTAVPSGFQRMKERAAQSVIIKLLSIGFLMLVMFVPSNMIQSLVYERQQRHGDAVREVSNKWGLKQQIAGPVLSIPYLEYAKDRGDKSDVIKNAHFLPNRLEITGSVTPEIHKRGIYEAVLYHAQLHIKGEFTAPDLAALSLAGEYTLPERAFLSVGIPDMRGINEHINLKWNNEALIFEPGISSNDVLSSGISVKVPIQLDQEDLTYTFDFSLDFNGSASLNFIPVGKETLVQLQSDWPDPSFDGAFLPKQHKITAKDFTANWKVLHLNRNFPQQWLKTNHKIQNASFGVKLLRPIDQYAKTNRSVKYAMMFIFLTFVGFFFVEILNKTRIHPLQYLLVGIGLCVFYLLLLSVSEHLNFNQAYLIATAAIVVLLTAYSQTVLKSKRLTLVTGLTLTALYGFLYSLLQLQDYALLMGSVGLFIFLAIVMYVSRNVDWYHPQGKEE